MAEQETSWVIPLTDVKMDARAARPAVRKPDAFRTIGASASLGGPLRVFPGLKEVHRFNVTEWNTLSSGNHNTTSEVVDCFPFQASASSDKYYYGFVVRVRRKNQATGTTACDIFIEYFESGTISFAGPWRFGLIKAGVPLPPDLDVTGGRLMDVVVWGRMLYVFVDDTEPISFNLDRISPWTTSINTDTGPGLRPTCVDPSKAGALGGIVALSDPDRPGDGQVVLLDFLPADTGLFTSPIQDATTVNYLAAGDYAFAYVLCNSQTGLRSALSDVAQARASEFVAVSGGTAQPLYAAIEICYDKTKYDQAYIYRSVRVQSAGGTYIASILHLDQIITLADYQTNNNPLADPDQAQSVYWYELEDKQLVFQDTFLDRSTFDQDMPKGGAAHWYENTMLVGSIRTAASSTSETNRPEDGVRGIGDIRWSALTEVSPELFPPANRYYPKNPGDSPLAFRSLDPNVLGFGRNTIFHIRKEGSYLKVQEVLGGFGVTGNKALEPVGGLVYFVTHQGLMAVDTNAQLEDVGVLNQIIVEEWAGSLETVSLAYDAQAQALVIHNMENEETAFIWFKTAQATLVRDMPFRQCASGRWPINFTFDYAELREPDPGANNAGYYNPTVQRAFFVQNSPKDTASEAVASFEPRVFVLDWERGRTHTSGAANNARDMGLLPNPSDPVFPVAADFTFLSGDTLELDTTGLTLATEIWGYEVYVLESADKSLLQKHATIKRVDGSNLILKTADAAQLLGLVEGDRVGLTPVYFEWQGYPLGTMTAEAEAFGIDQDFFRIKQFNSVGCAFSDVTGYALTLDPTLARFCGKAYRGAEDTAAATAWPVDPQGNPVQSVKAHESIHYGAFTQEGGSLVLSGKFGVTGSCLTPAISIAVPDLDFAVMGVRVTGRVLDSVRTSKATMP